MAKITKKEMFKAIAGVEGLTDEMRIFLKREIAILEKEKVKNAEKNAAKKNEKNSVFDSALIGLLSNGSLTTTEAADALGCSSQKVTGNVKRLIEAGKVVRTKTKEGVVYSLPEAES